MLKTAYIGMVTTATMSSDSAAAHEQVEHPVANLSRHLRVAVERLAQLVHRLRAPSHRSGARLWPSGTGCAQRDQR